LWLKKIRLTLLIVAAYRNWDILGVDLSIFVSYEAALDEVIAINSNNDDVQHSVRKPSIAL
jgi:hypothetical protein